MQEDTFSFIVRIWHEAVDRTGKITAWRGSIEQVGTGKHRYFEDMDGVVEFIQERAQIEAGPPRSRWKWMLTRIRQAIVKYDAGSRRARVDRD